MGEAVGDDAALTLLLQPVVADRGLRKAARRELHRLRSIGVQVPHIADQPLQTAATPRASEHVDVTEAWATDIDPTGSRALWLLGDRRLGGVWFAALLLNETRGVQELNLVDTTRKRYLRDFDANRGEAETWVSLLALSRWTSGPKTTATVRPPVSRRFAAVVSSVIVL